MSTHLSLTVIERIKDRVHAGESMSAPRSWAAMWSAEETVVAPQLAVRRVHVDNIAEYMG
jgi:hypothetical protein